MHVHILGICGTFMGSLALLARELGYKVTGSDANIYPPMSTQLERAGIDIQEGYKAAHLQPAPDLVIVGNAMKRGIEAVEYMLNQGLLYTSGPQFLAEQVLQHRHVLAVAGTHGKTTTTTMLAWILQYCGVDTGFLIGGVPLVESDDQRLNKVFSHSSYLGAHTTANTDDAGNVDAEPNNKGYFVIEADEYDSAFFDKRSKFVHYRPRTAILNNLEFDHADIFPDLAAIQTQFHHMIRMIPADGRIIMPANTPSLEQTLKLGTWTPVWRTQITDESNKTSVSNDNNAWDATLIKEDGSQFLVTYNLDAESQTEKAMQAEVNWSMSGRHNVENALVAVAAAYDIGIKVSHACEALSAFAGIKRRMELIGEFHVKQSPIKPLDDLNSNNNDKSVESTINVHLYDDFAHHPTAISTTLDGAKKKLIGKTILAIIEPRSNTMKLGVHRDSLAPSASLADSVIWYEPKGLEWGLTDVINLYDSNNQRQRVFDNTQNIIDYVLNYISTSAQDIAIVVMSNGGFEGLHTRLIEAIEQRAS